MVGFVNLMQSRITSKSVSKKDLSMFCRTVNMPWGGCLDYINHGKTWPTVGDSVPLTRVHDCINSRELAGHRRACAPLASKRVTGNFKPLLWLPCCGERYSGTALNMCKSHTHIKTVVQRGFTVNSDESKT